MSISRAIESASAALATFGEDKIPVPVEQLASQLGIRVLRETLDTDVSGLLVTNRSGAVIVVNNSDSQARQRFTIAHEIGHYVLRHQFESGEHVHVDRGNYISQRGPRAAQGIDPREIEANWFAASLLMPEGLVREAVEQMGAPVLFDNHVERLCRTFRVSEQAMTIRLQHLRLL